MNKPVIGYITLRVIDYQRSIEFFREIIGFPLLFDDEKFQFARFQAGDVTFAVTNTGPEDIHEFVVLKTDLDAGALPVDDTGAVSEEGEGITVVDEIEDIPVGESQDLSVSLDAGHYVLLCNIYSEDEQEAHYTQGMRTNFTVE